ncbi:uncharacterized protein MONOS_17625 [Monocercomonoides exilis]|uniref:uncharacterized protein n=1 Tax=Monocercomonoides exilis TaxID=2049356 RepID=UPI00355AA2BA|nr:hypothetical protein MONOS_17625 [Monocercomonoides exilis]
MEGTRQRKWQLALKEREQTAAQILFWVANLALNSFDEMDNPLSSLVNLSPHIVLFSGHMVICIAMHFDSSSQDLDPSSILSSTVVTSASDDDDDDSLPSYAFEDEESFKKKCLTLEIPFWECEAETVGKKIVMEKDQIWLQFALFFCELVKLTVSEKQGARPTPSELKREFIQRFPAGAVILTISDAVIHQEGYPKTQKWSNPDLWLPQK